MPEKVFQTQKIGTETVERVNSPCVSVCVLNQNDICTGCYRSGQEISSWGGLSNDQKREVLVVCQERAKQMNPFL